MEDAELIAGTRVLVAQVRKRWLERRGEGERPRSSRSLEQPVRSATIGELEVALGFSAWEAGLLVSAATAPVELFGVVDDSLRRGEVTWPSVRKFYLDTASLDEDARLVVAVALFGDDPDLAAADRLDPDGQLHGRAWSVPRYKAALAAEVAACKGTDAVSERAERARAYAARRLRITVHGDGTATMHITGPAPAVVAAGDRVDRAARGVRALGDERTLDHLRVDIALGLLVYAIVVLGAKPANPAPDTTADAAAGADDGAATVEETSNKVTNPAPAQDGVDDAADEGAQERADEDVADDADHGRDADDSEDADDGEDSRSQHRMAPADEVDVRSDGDRDRERGAEGCSCDAGEGQGQLFDEILAPADLELLARVVNGLPPVALQVVVPYSSLSGGFPICAHCCGSLDARQHPPAAGPAGGHPGEGSADREGEAAPHCCEQSSARDPGGPPHWARQDPALSDRADPGAGRSQAGSEHSKAHVRAGDGHGRETGGSHGRQGRRGRVGEVLGPNPFFITDGHARELALMPGTTLHRLVADLRDGRLVERTIKGYKPDTQMRRQVIAADVYSRAPGARVVSRAGELDHVRPYGWAGGPTGELNLALLAKRPHQYKTDGIWHVTIGARRDLTFTTLLGQVVTTRVHDYRTYLEKDPPADLDDRRDLAGQLLQAALADKAKKCGRRRDDWITLDHTDPLTGITRPGPHPHQPTLEDLLSTDEVGTDEAGTDEVGTDEVGND